MINVIDPKNSTKILNYDPHICALLEYNNIDVSKLSWCFPDKLKKYNFADVLCYFNQMEQIDGAADFINFVNAHKNEKSIVISDHDCDGIMACVIMTIGLNEYGIDVQYISTDRFITGYGMKKCNIDAAIKLGAKVIYTVDQGIVANDVIEYAQANGISVCVTDHHIGNECKANVAIDPNQNGNKTVFKEISGATVALKLIYSLFKSSNCDVTWLSDLAVLAGITVLSDCMQLVNENRILYKFMTAYCKKEIKYNSFVYRLAKIVNFFINVDGFEVPRDFNTTQLNFYFIPIINAVNRVNGDVTCLIMDIINSYYYDDFDIAERYDNADFYVEINKQRKAMKKSLQQLHVYDPERSVCVEAIIDEAFNLEFPYGGISGLLASDVVENEKKPALIGVIDTDDIVKFSGRSVPGYSLYTLLTKVQEKYPELDLKFGGHDQALGASIHRDKVSAFRDAICKIYDEDNYEFVEDYMSLDNAQAWLRVYSMFAPFGQGFKMPQFYTETNVSYFDSETNTIRFTSCGNIPVICFSYTDMQYLKFLIYKKMKSVPVQCVLDISLNEHGKPVFKIVDILNKDKAIEQQILEERNNAIT